MILDTNVLHAGLHSSRGASFQVLRLIERGRVRPVLSTTLLLEYEHVLKRNQASLGLSGSQVDAVLDGLCSRSDHQKVYFLWRPYLPDPNDDHILELAVPSRVDAVVTFNIKDFVGAEDFGIRVLTA